MDISTPQPPRRQFFTRIVQTIHATIAGTLGVVLGGSVLSPSFARREEHWLPAGSLASLTDNAPTAIALRTVREDGYTQVVDRRVVFLVKTGETSVAALDSTCTHLGCRVSWDAETKELRCPCHGGAYDYLGQVKAGPPPAPLARLSTRIDGDTIFVEV